MMAVRHPDSYLEFVGTDRKIVGPEQLRAFYHGLFAGGGHYAVDVDGEAFGVGTAVVWGQLRGSLPAGFSGYRGGTFATPAVFVWLFQNGQFTGDHMYLDPAAFGARS